MLKAKLQEDMKDALRAGEKQRLGAIRLAIAAINRIEIDSRTEMDDAAISALLQKLIKQGKDSEKQFRDGNRIDLADKEAGEIKVLGSYLPEGLSDEEVQAEVAACVKALGADSMKDMGRVMAELKGKLAGRADMGQVGQLVKSALS